MQPLPEEEFKTKDPELQRWLSSVLAKQQEESRKNIHDAHEQLRRYLDLKLQDVVTSNGGYSDADRVNAGFHLDDMNYVKPVRSQRSSTKESAHETAARQQADLMNIHMKDASVMNAMLPKVEDAAMIEIEDGDYQALQKSKDEDNPLAEDGCRVSRRDTLTGVMARIRAQGLRQTLSNGAMENKGRCIDWLMGEPMDIAAATAIFASTFVFFMQLQWKGYLCRVAMGLEGGGGWQGANQAFATAEFSFATIFLSELLIRLSYFKMTFFKDTMNCLDCLVVVVCSLDTFIFSQMEGVGGGNLVFTRMIRYAKLVRTLRFIRAMKLCHPLRVLIRTIASSFMALFWSMVILMVMMLMSGLFICQTLQEYIVDETQPWEQRVWIEKNYGNAAKALWTMFEITFSGGWPTWVSPLIEHVSVWYAVFFAAYVGGVVFAVIRIITALFLKDTLAVAANDNDMMIQQKAKERAKFVAKLEEIFREFDKSRDGMISLDEFNEFIKDPASQVYISQLELEPHELEGLFTLLDDGDSQVSFDEFLAGVMRLKGQARSHDVLVLLHDMRKISQHVKAMHEEVRALKAQSGRYNGASSNGSASMKRPAMVL